MSDIHSSFSLNDQGGVHILLDDPTFVRAETLLVDMRSGEIQALLHQKLHSLGAAPANIMAAFKDNCEVMLSAVRVDGSNLQLRSHVVILH